MVFHDESASSSCLVKDAAKVDELRCKSDRADCEHAQQAEFDGQYLVSTSDLYWNPHRKLFVLICGRLLILFH